METSYSKIEKLFYKVIFVLWQIHLDDICLENLKLLYKEEINSNRAYSDIKTFKCLIIVLQKRNLINIFNIDILYDFAPWLNDVNLITLFDEYKRKLNIFTEENCNRTINYYQQERRICIIPKQQIPKESVRLVNNVQESPRIQPADNMPKQNEKKRIYDTIAREIGKSWIDFARRLDIAEGEIDYIREKNKNNVKEAVYETLAIYEERVVNYNCFYLDILNALSKCRRNDLKGKIEHYIFECSKGVLSH